LNRAFSSADITWVLADMTLMKNSTWFMEAMPGSKAQKEMKRFHRSGGAGDLNIYSVG